MDKRVGPFVLPAKGKHVAIPVPEKPGIGLFMLLCRWQCAPRAGAETAHYPRFGANSLQQLFSGTFLLL
jgi:hypothetical protein